ncbi:MAG TPA: hypothetical protein PKW35_22510 [Nannocystaceae bacterium]|nr:hypothetical protein [Nannocystaceae bacterium]
MKTLSRITILACLLAIPSLARAEEPAGPTGITATAEASAEVSIEAEAEADDILLVLDLPLAAIDLRAAGVAEVEVVEAIDGAAESGVSAAAATEVLAAESDEVKVRGHKKGFGLYVQTLLAQGLRGPALAAKIHERKEEFAALSDEEKAKMKADLKARHEAEKERRKAIHEKRVEIRKAGKVIKIHEGEVHARLDKMRVAEKKAHHAKMGKIKAEIREEKAKDHPDKAKMHDLKADLHEEKAEHHEKMGKIEAREDRVEDRHDRAEEKLEKRDEKLEKREDRLEKREERREHAAEKIEAKKGKGPKKDAE